MVTGVRPPWPTLASVLVIAVALTAALLAVAVSDTADADAICAVSALAAAVTILVAVRRHRPRRRAEWSLIAFGIALWGLADLSRTLFGGGVHQGLLGTGQLLCFAGYAAFIAAATGLTRVRLVRRIGGLGAVLDALIVAVAAGLLVWLALTDPVVDTRPELLGDALIASSFPILDVFLLTLVAAAIQAVVAPPRAALLLAGALVSYLAADLLFVREALAGSSHLTADVAGGRVLGYGLVAAAALDPSMTRLTGAISRRPMTRLVGTVTGAAALVPGIAILVHDGDGGLDRLTVGLPALGLTGLILIRLFYALKAQARLREVVERRARYDPLTELANRRLFDDRLRRALRARTGVGLLYIDLDGFKQVNDGLGHRAGDLVLRSVARVLRDTLRAGDDIARLGGDEFAVILVDASDAAAVEALGVRVASVLADLSGPDGRPIGASVGTAFTSGPGLSPDELVRYADEAMYRVKRERRRVA